MSDENVNLVKNLDKLLFEDTESVVELRKRLESEGVDVATLVARVREASAEAYRAALRDEAQADKEQRQDKRGRLFGDLTSLGRDKLLDLLDKASRGELGQPAMARCRNQKAENMSESDLRSLLEDIESTIEN